MTIDPLSIASWIAALLLAWEAMRRNVSWPWWAAVGVASGVGMLCKYTNILALVGIALAVVLSPERRRHARGLAVSLLIALLALAPPLIWNARHGWVTLTHLAERGALDRGAWLRPRETLEFIVAHFGTWSPLIFVAILLAMPAAIRHARSGDEATRFLLATSAPVLLMYLLLALHEAGEANWTAPGIVGLVVIAAAHWSRRMSASARARAFVIAALAVGALLSAAIVDTDLVRAAGIPLPARRDPSTRLRGWQATANEVAQLRRTIEHEEGSQVLLVANHYGVASELAFYLPRAPIAAPDHPAVYVVPTTEPKNQFWFWPTFTDPGAGLTGRSALFVTDRASAPPDAMQDLFEGRCAPLEPIEIDRDGDVLRTMRPWLCRGLK
jgi:4-amino-4-deoxy-L-arabinose transferase-like glycosyltransferase